MNIYLVSLGCPKNTVDSEVMAGLLRDTGHDLTANLDEAAVALVNTCGFIGPAKEESLDCIAELISVKQQRPGLRLVVAGCLAQRYREELAQELPEVDAFLGVNDVPRIAEILHGLDAPGGPVAAPAQREISAGPDGLVVTGPMSGQGQELYLYNHTAPRQRLTPRHYAYVKASEGCHHRCTFCAIPAIRGPFRSRPPEDVLAEIRQLLAEGVKEVLLIGQDTTAYGHDLPGRPTVAHLLQQAAALPGRFWLRLMYAYPSEISDALLATMAANPNICPYLDIPFQHAHPDVLRAMGRGGDADSFLRLLERARRIVPGLAIRTSLIVGFPGETEAHFRCLKDFVAAAGFDSLGVFTYSDEEGTPASGLTKKVNEEKAAQRRDTLMRLQQRLLRKTGPQRVGDVVEALVDGPEPMWENMIAARLATQAPDIDGNLLLVEWPEERGPAAGTFVRVRLEKFLGYDYTAKVLADGQTGLG